VDSAGYCLDADGVVIETEYGPMAAHFGRRCWGQVRIGGGKHGRCSYRWTSKECPHCDAPNDIAARYCIECKGEIVDPNDKLIGDFRAMKRDPLQRQTDRVVSMAMREGVSAKGNKTVRVDFVTQYRSFSIWLMPEATFPRAQQDWQMFQDAATRDVFADAPATVTYQKSADGFYRVFAYNRPADESPEGMQHAAE